MRRSASASTARSRAWGNGSRAGITPDDLVRRAVEQHLPAQRSPDRPPKRDCQSPWLSTIARRRAFPVVVRPEHAADERRHAQQREKVGADPVAVEALGIAARPTRLTDRFRRRRPSLSKDVLVPLPVAVVARARAPCASSRGPTRPATGAPAARARAKGSGRTSTWSVTEKAAVVAPTPSAATSDRRGGEAGRARNDAQRVAQVLRRRARAWTRRALASRSPAVSSHTQAPPSGPEASRRRRAKMRAHLRAVLGAERRRVQAQQHAVRRITPSPARGPRARASFTSWDSRRRLGAGDRGAQRP